MDKKRPKPRKKDKRGEDDGPTKEEKAVATYLRFNVPTKSTTLHGGEEVHYFTGAKAVDFLMESNWKTGKKKTEILFCNRQGCLNYLQRLLEKGMFWRARKMIPKRKAKNGEETKDTKEGGKETKKGKKKEKEDGETGENNEDTPETASKSPKRSKKNEDREEEDNEKEEEEEKKKKKKKVKLDFHQEQVCKDTVDAFYVWHFDPTPWTKFLLGLGIVVGSVVLCLFPLWPPWMRLGVYYVSVVAMGFVGVLIGLIVLRSIVFGVVWAATWGNHHLWILPNLTEDCGFFESFKPYYSHKYTGDKDKDKKKKKDKDSDSDGGGENKEEENAGDAPNTDTDREGESEEEGETGGEETPAEESSVPGTPSQGGGARRRKRRRKDEGGGKPPTTPEGNNGFEMVDGAEGED